MSFQSLQKIRVSRDITQEAESRYIPNFEVVLHLGKVEVGSETSLDKFGGVVEKVETKVEHGSRHGFTVDDDSCFVKVPASRSGGCSERQST